MTNCNLFTEFKFFSQLSSGSALPSFISFDENSSNYTIYSTSPSDVGNYTVHIYSYLLTNRSVTKDHDLSLIHI